MGAWNFEHLKQQCGEDLTKEKAERARD